MYVFTARGPKPLLFTYKITYSIYSESTQSLIYVLKLPHEINYHKSVQSMNYVFYSGLHCNQKKMVSNKNEYQFKRKHQLKSWSESRSALISVEAPPIKLEFR